MTFADCTKRTQELGGGAWLERCYEGGRYALVWNAPDGSKEWLLTSLREFDEALAELRSMMAQYASGSGSCPSHPSYASHVSHAPGAN